MESVLTQSFSPADNFDAGGVLDWSFKSGVLGCAIGNSIVDDLSNQIPQQPQPQPQQGDTAIIEFLNSIHGDIVNRFWPRFVSKGIVDLHSLSKLSEMQLRELVPPLGVFRSLYNELQKDWHCTKCGFINYARYGNANCYRCSHPRTGSITAAMANKDADSNRISSMLHEREQARRSQNFERADAIREQLRAMGVVWDDDMRTWRTVDGRCGRWGTPSHAATTAGAAQGGYCIKLRGLPFRIRYDDIKNFFALAGIEILQYSVVLEKNADGRPSGVGYVKVATQLEEQIACSQLNHKHIPGYDRYAWVVESNEVEYQTAKNSWAGIVLNDGPSEGDNQVTSQKLKEREECRKLRQYERADSIREDLRDQGVTFDDELRTWSDKLGGSGRWGVRTSSHAQRRSTEELMLQNVNVQKIVGVLPPLDQSIWESSMFSDHSANNTLCCLDNNMITATGTTATTTPTITATILDEESIEGLHLIDNSESLLESIVETPVDEDDEDSELFDQDLANLLGVYSANSNLDESDSLIAYEGSSTMYQSLTPITPLCLSHSSCSDPKDDEVSAFQPPTSPSSTFNDAPLVDRLQNILFAVAESPTSP